MDLVKLKLSCISCEHLWALVSLTCFSFTSHTTHSFLRRMVEAVRWRADESADSGHTPWTDFLTSTGVSTLGKLFNCPRYHLAYLWNEHVIRTCPVGLLEGFNELMCVKSLEQPCEWGSNISISRWGLNLLRSLQWTCNGSETGPSYPIPEPILLIINYPSWCSLFLNLCFSVF